MAAACVYLYCRQEGRAFLLIDFADQLQINVFTLGAVFLQLAKLLRLEEHPILSKPVDPSLYIERFTDKLLGAEFTKPQKKEVSNTAIRLVASMKRDWIQTGRRPSGICGAALYIATHAHGYETPKKNIVHVVKIGEHTLAKRLSEFTATEAAEMTADHFKAFNDKFLENETKAIEDSAPSSTPDGMLTGCEHVSLGVEHFKQGMCKECYVHFIKVSGGTFDGANPPAFRRARQVEEKKKAAEALLALPAPTGDGDATGKGEEEEKEEGGGRGGAKRKKTNTTGAKEKTKAKGKGRKRGAEEDGTGEQEQEQQQEEGEEDGPTLAAATTLQGLSRVTAAMVAAAEREVASFDVAIAEEEEKDSSKKKGKHKKRRMSVRAAIAAAEAQALRDVARSTGGVVLDQQMADAVAQDIVPGAGAGAGGVLGVGAGLPADTFAFREAVGMATGRGEDEATQGNEGAIVPVVTAATTTTTQQEGQQVGVGPGPGTAAEQEQEQNREEEDRLSDISDTDIAMYIADEAEVACKEEIWNMMNQDWVEKQGAKRAAVEKVEKAQAEQRAAMEAAAAAGIQFKRGRGRPLGSKTKPKPEQNLPPPATPQEAALRMLNKKKLSSKINYSVLANLFNEDDAVHLAGGVSEDGGGGSGGAAMTTTSTTSTSSSSSSSSSSDDDDDDEKEEEEEEAKKLGQKRRGKEQAEDVQLSLPKSNVTTTTTKRIKSVLKKESSVISVSRKGTMGPPPPRKPAATRLGGLHEGLPSTSGSGSGGANAMPKPPLTTLLGAGVGGGVGVGGKKPSHQHPPSSFKVRFKPGTKTS